MTSPPFKVQRILPVATRKSLRSSLPLLALAFFALAATSVACGTVDTSESPPKTAPTFEAAPTVEAAPTFEAAPTAQAAPTFEAAPTVAPAPTVKAAPTVKPAPTIRSVGPSAPKEAASDTSSTAPAPERTPREFNIVTLLAPDAIPAITNPTFFDSTEDADAVYRETELVLGIEIDGDARAYSVPLLSRHEIVNDVVAGNPVAVTW